MTTSDDATRDFLRHTVATLAYRGGKAVRGAPAGFGDRRIVETARSAVEILAHIGDLLEWALWLAKGQHVWKDAVPQMWEDEVARFFDGLRRLDDYLASDAPLGHPPERLFQGPIADALTHVGQIATLRRVAGAPVRGENYFRADIAIGRVGPEQSAPRVEFD
ncbi:MAG: hypothetical protein QN178_01690 [Armatimonadota bacterium]|nr:hypothetical protein [Armatimonadota bacterium]